MFTNKKAEENRSAIVVLSDDAEEVMISANKEAKEEGRNEGWGSQETTTIKETKVAEGENKSKCDENPWLTQDSKPTNDNSNFCDKPKSSWMNSGEGGF